MMKVYNSYKDSGVDWIGKIPIKWNITKLKYQLADVPYPIVDGPFGTQLKAAEYTDSGIPLVRISNLDFMGNLSMNDIKYISESKAEEISRSKIIIDDLIIGKTGATIGKSGLNKLIPHGVISSSCLKISINKNRLFPEYFKYYVTSDNFQEIILQTASGSTRDTINITPMSNLEVLLPLLSEQTKIAQFLDHQTGIIDALIEKKEQLIERLKEQRQAIINEAVTKGLDPNAKMKDSGVEWLGEIPEGWEVVKLGRLGTFSKGKGITRDVVQDKGLPCVRYGELYTTFDVYFESPISFISEKYSCNSICYQKNILLMAGDGETNEDIGKTVLYSGEQDIYVGGGINVLVPNEEQINPLFLSYALNSSYSIHQKSRDGRGGIIVHIYAKQLKEHYVITPPYEEQSKIAEFIQDKLETIDNIVLSIKDQIISFKSYRQSLISEAVTGKIDVRDWEPTTNKTTV